MNDRPKKLTYIVRTIDGSTHRISTDEYLTRNDNGNFFVLRNDKIELMVKQDCVVFIERKENSG